MRKKKVPLNLKIKPHLNELIVREAEEQRVSKTEILERCVQSYFLGKEGATRSAVQTVFQPASSINQAETKSINRLHEILEKQTETFSTLALAVDQLIEKLGSSAQADTRLPDLIDRQTEALGELTSALGGLVLQTDDKTDKKTASNKAHIKPASKGSESPRYRYRGKTATLREHLLREFPGLSNDELKKARNNINRSIKGRGGKSGKKPEEAIAHQVDLLGKKTEKRGGEGYA